MESIHISGSEVDPDKFGIIGHRGAEDKQPFLTGFFKSSQKVNIRKTRAAERHKEKAMNVMSADEPAYRYTSKFDCILYIIELFKYISLSHASMGTP